MVHGVSFTSVFSSVWGVVDVVNSCTKLSFEFPSHEDQKIIANDFLQRSGANFGNVVGAIDGILIWILKPNSQICRQLNCGEAQFKCTRKDKFGFNMQAICDAALRFIWVDIRWPGATSDYMAWSTSELCLALEDDGKQIMYDGMTIVGDNAYVKKSYMSVPFKGSQMGYNDAYNFYISQLRITIERCFGVLVHRWAILRAPLTIPTQKVCALVICLCRLHNFCIDNGENQVVKVPVENVKHLHSLVHVSNDSFKTQSDKNSVVHFDRFGRPNELLNHGHHFEDAPHNRRVIGEDICPMDRMLLQVVRQNLVRPSAK